MPTSKRRAGVKSKQARRVKTSMPIKNKPSTEIVFKELPIVNVVPKDLPVLYSDNFLIQNRETMFISYFMQNQHPLLLTNEDVQKIDEIESICVARVTTTALQFAKNLRAMEENFNKFLEMAGSDAKSYKEFLKKIDIAESKIDTIQ